MKESERMPKEKMMGMLKKDTPRNVEDECKMTCGKRDQFGRVSTNGKNFGNA